VSAHVWTKDDSSGSTVCRTGTLPKENAWVWERSRAHFPEKTMRPFCSYITKRRLLLGSILGLAIAAVAFWVRSSDLEWRQLPRAMESLDSVTVLALAVVVPVVGFPISVIYLIVGARFGPIIGISLIAGLTAGHLIATHWIARGFLRARLLRVMARHQHRIPAVPVGENAAVSLMIMLAPAIPYFIRNYALALSGIPLRIYFAIALPVHVARSCVALFLGDLGTDPSREGFYLIVSFYAIKLLIFAGVAWWLRQRHKRLKRSAAPSGLRLRP
jgi:uncharacterized membrane protein YdjX (TVP38/TMEM64 family)